ncbi:hypothetical protein F2Q70_00022811 [Brassica cretica]|uniref:DNA-directed DNA polymerase family A palm domain-containing protein n=1 Tax=Brassica cretica TaxID=69181 RepID=A0A8S9GUH9_BRACR|nr:hypothetical protein F2Q70_00022811 [Brassica cretica]
MGVSLRHFSPSSFWVSRRPRASSSVLSLLVPRHRILTRKVVITNGNARYCTASASGGSHGFQHSGRQGSSSTVEFSGEWKLSVGSKTAIMVPPTVKLTGAVSAWRKEEVNQDDASGNGSNYFVPKIDYGNYQTLDNQLESRGDVVTTVDRELNGFAQQKSQRGPLVALPREKIDDKNTLSISKVGKRTDLSKVRANLTKIYNKVRVVDSVSTAKEIVTKLVNQYRDLVHACDTEVSRIDVKSETPVDHGELICFSIYCGSEADFGDGKSCIWVDVLGENGKDVLAEFKPFFEDSVAGGDFHSRTAMNMYPHIREAVENGQVLLEWHPQPGQEKPPVPLLKDAFASERRKAKMLNFSIAYGKTAIGLSRDWKVSVEEAQETVNLWYNDRQEVRKWQELRKKEAIQNGYVLTLLGRARKFPAYRSRAQKNHIERAAINTPVQGSAADVAMCAMLEITTNERLNELGWKLLLQVHDEVILEGPSESAELAKSIVVDCMCKPFNGKNILSVDLSVDAKCAQNWYAAK